MRSDRVSVCIEQNAEETRRLKRIIDYVFDHTYIEKNPDVVMAYLEHDPKNKPKIYPHPK